jgi:ATP-dependent DNA helicase RecG
MCLCQRCWRSIIVGVDDQNVIQGISIDNAKISAIQHSLNQINPYIHTSLYQVKLESKAVWVIEVNSGNQKPYALSGAIFVRQGPNSQKLTSVEQMRAFFQQADCIYFDEAPCNSFQIENDLDSNWFTEFRNLSQLSSSISQEQIIHNLKLTHPNGVIKNGAVLFFGHQPDRFVDTAELRCTAFQGINKTHIMDDKLWKGPLMQQYRQGMRWLKEKLNIAYQISGGGPRKELWEIPEVAFKEALINALSHRDYYDKGARIQVEVYEDRVEITNPGGLTQAIPVSEFGSKSHSRNPLIFGLFERIDMVEQIGSGIGRIQNAMAEALLPAPTFQTDGIFTVTFKRPHSSGKSSGVDWKGVRAEIENKSTVKLRKSALKILEMVFHNPEITIPEMATRLAITHRGVEKNIKKLKELGLLSRKDGAKGGYWQINF